MRATPKTLLCILFKSVANSIVATGRILRTYLDGVCVTLMGVFVVNAVHNIAEHAFQTIMSSRIIVHHKLRFPGVLNEPRLNSSLLEG